MIELGSIVLVEPAEPASRERPERLPVVLTTAELAECTCPEFCERDHDVD
jgi:hypothetical protein